MSDPDMSDNRQRRWRLLLGDPASTALGGVSGADAAMDGALNALYEHPNVEVVTGRPGSGIPRRGWLAGWRTSERTSHPVSCR